MQGSSLACHAALFSDLLLRPSPAYLGLQCPFFSDDPGVSKLRLGSVFLKVVGLGFLGQVQFREDRCFMLESLQKQRP